jgi:uncharacterized protein (DUF2336 family)
MNTQNSLIRDLEDALSSGTAERRERTLRRVTDLFVFGSKHFSADHISVFDDVFTHLIADIEQSARQVLADRIAAIPNAPPKVIHELAVDDAIEVAGPILTQADQVDNVTLIEAAKTKSQQHLLAIARRPTLAETVTDVLVERGNRDVALSVVQNPGAKFSETGYVRLVKRSSNDDEFAQSVGTRPEIPRHHFVKLLNTASRAVRIALEAAHPDRAREVQDVVAQVATAIQVKAVATSRDYATARALVESLRAAGRLGAEDLAVFAGSGRFEETVAALAAMSALPIDVVERVLVQDRGDTVMIVAKAIDLSWPTLRSLLLLQAGSGGLSRQTLDQHMASFMRLKRATALQAVEFLRRRQVTNSKSR